MIVIFSKRLKTISFIFALTLIFNFIGIDVVEAAGEDLQENPKTNIVQLQFNTIEELNHYYDNGYRLMAVYIEYDTDGDIILSDSITLKDLVKWLEKHSDVQVVLRTKEPDYEILVQAHEEYPMLIKQGIAEIQDMEHYMKVTFSGFRKVILNTKVRGYTDDEIKVNIYNYPYFGVILDKDKVVPSMMESIRAGRTLAFVEEGNLGNFSKYVLEKTIDGYILDPKVEYDKTPVNPTIENPYIIAHAGGQLGGHTYTNAIDAMENSYKNGVRLMEMDFDWSTDGELVGMHSWDGFVTKFFNVISKAYSYYEYENFQMINGWQQSTPQTLEDWFVDHPDAYLVTDIKGNNIEGLRILKERHPDLAERTIPQIYQLSEYQAVKDLGYDNIILTLYIIRSTDDEIVEFARDNHLFGVTMPDFKAQTDLPYRLKELGVYVYSHTINSLNQAEELERLGVSGFYSDMPWNDKFIVLPPM